MDTVNNIMFTQQETSKSVILTYETNIKEITTIRIPTVDLTVPTINIQDTMPAYFTPLCPPVVDLSGDDTREIQLFPETVATIVIEPHVPLNSAPGITVSPDNEVSHTCGGRRAAFLTKATSMYTQIGQVITSLNIIVGHEEAIANEARGRLDSQKTLKRRWKQLGRDVMELVKGCTEMKSANRRR